MELASLEALRRFVQEVICERGQLLPGAFTCEEQVLTRNGRPCGLHFALSGPRSVRFSAAWDAVHHTILFYDCTGERFQRTELSKRSNLYFELAEFFGSGDMSAHAAIGPAPH